MFYLKHCKTIIHLKTRIGIENKKKQQIYSNLQRITNIIIDAIIKTNQDQSHSFIHTYICILYTCIHAYMHTYKHTYIHTYIQTYICILSYSILITLIWQYTS